MKKYYELLEKISSKIMPEECSGCLCGVSDCANIDGSSDCENYNLIKPLYNLIKNVEKQEQIINEIKTWCNYTIKKEKDFRQSKEHSFYIGQHDASVEILTIIESEVIEWKV